ncbi:MAG: hypothetical protein IV086_03910 [Hyphomonadaceae bacterium]|nr:hypothetical protein [Hyphomonadaceae bacterium]
MVKPDDAIVRGVVARFALGCRRKVPLRATDRALSIMTTGALARGAGKDAACMAGGASNFAVRAGQGEASALVVEGRRCRLGVRGVELADAKQREDRDDEDKNESQLRGACLTKCVRGHHNPSSPQWPRPKHAES